MELYEFKVGPNECIFLLLMLGIIIDENFELYKHVRKKLVDVNYIENYIYIENIDKIYKVCITSDTENLDESLTLSKAECRKVSFTGFQNIKNKKNYHYTSKC